MKSNRNWLRRHHQDQYVKKARKENYRSRAAFKLKQIDETDRLFRPGQTVVDLGAAPGGWSQYVAKRIQPGGKIIAVDILQMEPLDNVQFIQGDFSEIQVYRHIREVIGEHKVDLVISDLSPNITGIKHTDQARSLYLAELVVAFGCETLCKGGAILLKVFQGSGVEDMRKELSNKFQKLMIRKPPASRDASREFYILASGFGI
jgi:23S rRNA (uridine2552-2'-O)-methyltransferase